MKKFLSILLVFPALVFAQEGNYSIKGTLKGMPDKTELVLKNEEGEIDSVSYGRITAVLIEAIKELKMEIEELKNR